MLEAGPCVETVFAGERELGFGERGGGLTGAEPAEQILCLFVQLLQRGSRGKAAGESAITISFQRPVSA